MGLGVKNVTVNTGQSAKITGFLNPRLPPKLGVNNYGRGQAFHFALQVSFELDDIPPSGVTPLRTVLMKTHWTDPLAAKLSKLGAMPAAPSNIRTGSPDKRDDPNSQNVLLLDSRLIVMDGPGPSNVLVMKEAVHYPITFEGKFRLYLKHNPSGLDIANVVYYIKLHKPGINSDVTGEFELMEIKWASLLATVSQSPGELPGAPVYSVLGWMSRAL